MCIYSASQKSLNPRCGLDSHSLAESAYTTSTRKPSAFECARSAGASECECECVRVYTRSRLNS